MQSASRIKILHKAKKSNIGEYIENDGAIFKNSAAESLSRPSAFH